MMMRNSKPLNGGELLRDGNKYEEYQVGCKELL
jgi:hypothetical protein